MFSCELRDICNCLTRSLASENRMLAKVDSNNIRYPVSEIIKQTHISELWETLRRHFGESAPIQIGKYFRPSISPTFVLSAAEHTLKNGCVRLCELWGLYCECSDIHIHDRSNEFVIVFDSLQIFPSSDCIIQFRMSSFLAWMRWITGLDIKPARVLFSCMPPESTSVFDDHFLSPIFFHAGVNELCFSAEISEIPLLGGDKKFIERIADYAEELRHSQKGDSEMVRKVRRAIRRAIDSDVGIKTLAPRMGMSVRSLQRLLRSSGIKFSDLVVDIRLEAACQYLLFSGLSVGEITRRIGYSNAPNFVRAFRRQTGTTPDEYRRKFRGRST